MIGIIVATHGGFAAGMVDGMELLCGRQEKVVAFGLRIEDDLDAFAEEIIRKADELDDGDGVLLLVDFVGGSPANITGGLLAGRRNMEGIAGVNFPMLLEAINSRDEGTLKELTDQCKAVGRMGIIDIKERMEEMEKEDE